MANWSDTVYSNNNKIHSIVNEQAKHEFQNIKSLGIFYRTIFFTVMEGKKWDTLSNQIFIWSGFVNIHVLWHVVYANDDASKCGSISLIASDAHFAVLCHVLQCLTAKSSIFVRNSRKHCALLKCIWPLCPCRTMIIFLFSCFKSIDCFDLQSFFHWAKRFWLNSLCVCVFCLFSREKLPFYVQIYYTCTMDNDWSVPFVIIGGLCQLI